MAIGYLGRLIVALFCIAFVTYFFIASWGLKDSAKIAPLFISSVALVIMIPLTWTETRNFIRSRKTKQNAVQEEDGEEEMMSRQTLVMISVVFAWLIGSVLLLYWFDYMYVMPIMLFVLTYFVNRKTLKQSIISAVAMGVFLYVLFKEILNV